MELKLRPNGTYDLISVDTIFRDEAPFLRKAGMGGARYMRHCLETAVLERGGLWMSETIEVALDILEKLDGGLVASACFEQWVYVADGDKVDRQAIQPHPPVPHAALQHRKFIEKDLNWAGQFAQSTAQAAEELGRTSLRSLWQERYVDTLDDYKQSMATDGQVLCALLTRQAWAERQFLHQTGTDEAFAIAPFLNMLGARYIRALCQFDLSAANPETTNPLTPDLTEVGRTILLLCAGGRALEAIELGARAAPYLTPETLFIPHVPRLALAIAATRNDLLDIAANNFGTTLQADCQAVLRYLDGADDNDLAPAILRIMDARARQMGSYSDEYHIDYDDGLSWAMPYEALAILKLCEHLKRPAPEIAHAALDLPTAKIPDLRQSEMPYHDIYAAFLERRS